MAWKEGIWISLKERLLNIKPNNNEIPKKIEKKEVLIIKNLS
jgi:hypothetical protein